MKRFELEYSAEDFGVMDWGVMRAATPMGCYNCVRLKGAGEILREILSSRIRTKSGADPNFAKSQKLGFNLKSKIS